MPCPAPPIRSDPIQSSPWRDALNEHGNMYSPGHRAAYRSLTPYLLQPWRLSMSCGSYSSFDPHRRSMLVRSALVDSHLLLSSRRASLFTRMCVYIYISSRIAAAIHLILVFSKAALTYSSMTMATTRAFCSNEHPLDRCSCVPLVTTF